MLFYWRHDVTSFFFISLTLLPFDNQYFENGSQQNDNVCTILKHIVHYIKKLQNTKFHILVHFVGFVMHRLI